jgi:hypothetical protein
MWDNLKRWKAQRIGKIEPTLNTRLVWSVMGLFAVFDAIGLKAEGIRLVSHDFLSNILTITILLTISVIYTYFRPSARIAEMTHMGAVFLCFAAVSATCSYLVAGWGRPLVDSYLAGADHALGLDWLAGYKWVAARPLIKKALFAAYGSLIPQIIFLLLFLNFRGRCARSWEMIWLFMVSCTICLVFSGLWPAAGAFGYYHVEQDSSYLRVFTALHNGTLKVIGDSRVEGIIQFPSFHMALAILLTYVARGMPILFITLLELNILVTISTPPIGGHHFADLWGGVILAFMTIMLVRKAFAAGMMPDTEKISSM